MSSAVIVGYGTTTRAAVVAVHSGRVAFIYHAPSYLQPGLIAGREPAAATARNFLMPYAAMGRRAIVSIPLYLPALGVTLLALRRRGGGARRRGFAVVPRGRAKRCAARQGGEM
jgi:hypothetical protein